jgi:hypothetical protein
MADKYNAGSRGMLPMDNGAWVRATDYDALAAEVERLSKEWDKYRLALEHLTPGGSEFHADAERCARYVKETFDSNHATMKRAIKQRNEARAEVERLRGALARLTALGEAMRDMLSAFADDGIKSPYPYVRKEAQGAKAACEGLADALIDANAALALRPAATPETGAGTGAPPLNDLSTNWH